MTDKERLAPHFIQRPIRHRILELLKVRSSPILVTGDAGIGKTTLLRFLEQVWTEEGLPAIYVRLHRVGRRKYFIQEIKRSIDEAFALNRPPATVQVGDSWDELIKSLQKSTLFLLDGLDESPDPVAVEREISALAREADVLIVVSSRSLSNFHSRLYKHTIELPRPGHLEVAELLRCIVPESDKIQVIIDLLDAKNYPIYTINALAAASIETLNRISTYQSNKVSDLLENIINECSSTERQPTLDILTLAALQQTGTPISQISALGQSHLERLIKARLVVQDGDLVSLAHSAFAEHVLRISRILPDPAPYLHELDFGAEEAERDTLLQDNFIYLAGYKKLKLGKCSYVIGDRGAGKSAIFSQLTTIMDKSVIVAATARPAELLGKLEATGNKLSTAAQFQAGWLALAAYRLASTLKDKLTCEKQKLAADELMELFGDKPASTFVGDVLKKIKSANFKIKVGPIDFEPDRKGNKETIDAQTFIALVTKRCEELGIRVAIPLDHIDEVHKYDRAMQEKAIQGLVLAESKLAETNRVNFVIFIRTDLYHVYEIEEKNKVVSRTLNIEWTNLELLKFLVGRALSDDNFSALRSFLARLPAEAGAHEVALGAMFPALIEGVCSVDWLFDSMKNANDHVTPRQLALLLILATQTKAAKGHQVNTFPLFPEQALRDAMDELSNMSFTELHDDFRVSRTFLVNCRAGRKTSFEVRKVENLFGEADGPIDSQITRLEKLGFLQRKIITNDGGTDVVQFQVPKLFTRAWNATT